MGSRYSLFIALSALALAACGTSAANTDAVGEPPSSVTTLPPVTTTTTTPAPTTTTTTIPAPIDTPRSRVVIQGVGDVNLDPTFVRTFPSEGYDYAWSGLDGIFLRDDLTVINLECSPSPNGVPWDKPWNFRCPDGHPEMAEAGVEVVNLANNHAMDFGMDAMLDGRERLIAAGLAPVGAGANREVAHAPALVEANGWTIAVIGSGGVNPETGSWSAGDDRPGMSHGNNTEAIADAIRAADEVADLVIVTAHWGENGGTVTRPFERSQAEAWIDAGADGIFGHHQHVLHPLEWYDGKPIAFGLGNFVWQAYGPGRTTAIAQFVYEPDGRIGACLVPVYIERPGHPVLQEPAAPVCAPDRGQ